MKTITSTFIFVIFALHLSYVDINSQIINSVYKNVEIREVDLPDTNSVESPAYNLPWSNSVFISGGYGLQQGLIFELGYNFGSSISLAAIMGMNNKWAGQWAGHDKPTYGIIFKFYTLQIKSISNYIIIGFGAGGSDKYFLIHLGAKIPFSDWLCLCPEIGPFFASDCVREGYWNPFGPSESTIYRREILMGVNISLEINF